MQQAQRLDEDEVGFGGGWVDWAGWGCWPASLLAWVDCIVSSSVIDVSSGEGRGLCPAAAR